MRVHAALVLCLSLAPAAGAWAEAKPTSQPTSSPARAPLSIDGTAVLPAAAVRRAAGAAPPHDATDTTLRLWLVAASSRIERLYARRGYTQAHIYSKLDGARGQRRLRMRVDEGRVLLVVHGVGTFQQILYRVDLQLPKNIFHAPTVAASVREIKRKYGLAGAYYRIGSQRPLVPAGFGALVPQRVLYVYILTRESFGWRFRLSLSSTWGILPEVGISHRGLFLEDDRAKASLQIAFPYRRFVFEQDPEFQWVHSRLHISYRLPALKKSIAPKLEGRTAVSRYGRSEPGLQSYYTFGVTGLAKLVLLFPPFVQVELGGGIAHTRVFDLDRGPEEPTAPPRSDEPLTRYVGRADMRMRLDRDLRRGDLRNTFDLGVKVGVSSAGDSIADIRFRTQLVGHIKQHTFIARARGVFLAGDVRFWDEEPLAGYYQRAFFGNRYWVHEALQLSLEARIFIKRWISAGVFHDVSTFFDRTTDNNIAVANAFGPSLHFFALDLLAFDIYYAFGFAPVGFDHNLAFRVQTVF
ncbi:MAG: hypothetical protein KC503_22095 [Myxococcales bacterium]|nr:hypothetical protein [Myxococcales bacterium]